MELSHTYIKQSAKAILKDFDHWIEDYKIIESIYSSYVKICEDSLKKFGVKAETLSREIFYRIKFEILSFGSCLAFLLPLTILSKNSIFRRNLSDNKAAMIYFRNCIWSLMNDIVKNQKFDDFKEIVLKQINPKIQFGHGDPLNYDNRCNEYAKAFLEYKDGSEIKIFGKKIGVVLDCYNYHILSIIGEQVSRLIKDFIEMELNHFFVDPKKYWSYEFLQKAVKGPYINLDYDAKNIDLYINRIEKWLKPKVLNKFRNQDYQCRTYELEGFQFDLFCSREEGVLIHTDKESHNTILRSIAQIITRNNS